MAKWIQSTDQADSKNALSWLKLQNQQYSIQRKAYL